MDIGFTEEQELLRESARRFLENECSSAFVRQRMAESEAMTGAFWQKLAREHDLQLDFKRAKACEVAFGDATWHRERVARVITVQPRAG